MRTSRASFSRGTIYLFVLSATLIIHARSQTEADSSEADSSEASAESFLDQLETDATEQLDRFQWLQDHPFNLNTVRREELMTIPRLSPAEAAAIINLRKRLKQFESVEQLRVIGNDGEAILGKVRPYVMVQISDGLAKPMTVNFITRTSRDLQPRSGFQQNSFVGSPIKSYNRLIFSQPEQVEAGVLFEKDAGERFGESFLAGYAAVKNILFVSQAIVGDYVIEAGQGLVLWRASAFGKGAEAVSIAQKSGLGAQPYRSVGEFDFLRGGTIASGFDFGENKVTATVFYSRRSLSATSDTDGVSSLYEEGLFRTQSELQKRNTLVETIMGGRVQYLSSHDWNIGSTFYRSRFDKPIVSGRLFEFSGTSASAAGIDAELHLGWLAPNLSQITLFGEIARSGDRASAGIVGSILNLTRGASFALVYRDYSPRFVTLHSAGFGERSEAKNERGFYIGADIRVTNWLHVSGYLDHFTFPWRTFDNPLPTSGRDMLFQVSLSPKLDLTLRYSNKKTETTEASFDDFSRESRPLADRLQQKIRLTASYQAGKRIRLRGRIEKTFVAYSPLDRSESGILIYQELRYSLPQKFTAEARLIFFDTDSYDSRVYEFENDLRGVFANPALYGKGRRWYLLARWKAADMISLSAKYSETQFDGVKSIGSGLTEIQGDVDNRIAFQLDVKF